MSALEAAETMQPAVPAGEATEYTYDLSPGADGNAGGGAALAVAAGGGIIIRELGPPPPDPAAPEAPAVGHQRCYREKAVDDCTGLSVWASAVVLGRWCAANPAKLEGKRCLELGAGTGLAGLAAAAYARPASVCLTDFADSTLANLRHNVELNSGAAVSMPVSVAQMDWDDPETWPAPPAGAGGGVAQYDVLLGADLLYTRSAPCCSWQR